jgi:hypothetical protein
MLSDSEICYGVMFDAGSSGTRVYVYKWPCRVIQSMVNVNIGEEVVSNYFNLHKEPRKENQAWYRHIRKQPSRHPAIPPTTYWLCKPECACRLPKIHSHPSRSHSWNEIAKWGQAETDHRCCQTIIHPKRLSIRRIGLGKSYIRIRWSNTFKQIVIIKGAYMWLTTNYLLQNILPSPSLTTVLTIDIGGAST